MSRSNWLPNAPVGTGLIIVAALFFTGLRNHKNQTDCRHYETDQSKCDVGGVIPSVVGVAGYPPPPEKNPQRKEWREEQDLRAQRDMAEWAFDAMLAAWVAALGTVAGVVYVALTLRTTRGLLREAVKTSNAAYDSIKITRESAQHELRAYMTVHGGHIAFIPLGCGQGEIQWEITIKNTGQTSANGVETRSSGKIHDAGSPPPPHDPWREIECRSRSITGAQGFIHISGHQQIPSNYFDERMHPVGWDFNIVGRIDFTDVFGRYQYFEFVCGKGRAMEPTGWGIQPTSAGYQASQSGAETPNYYTPYVE